MASFSFFAFIISQFCFFAIEIEKLFHKRAPTGTVGALGIFVSEDLMLLRWGAFLFRRLPVSQAGRFLHTEKVF